MLVGVADIVHVACALHSAAALHARAAAIKEVQGSSAKALGRQYSNGDIAGTLWWSLR
jgi:hypothetical protein